MLATRSAGKLSELRPLFREAGLDVIDLAEARVTESAAEADIEAYETFEENALAKARYFHALCGGLDVVADDSGLCIDALAGAPGVRSKRWSGRLEGPSHEIDAANNAKLAASLEGIANRSARFVCAAAWCGVRGELVTQGTVEGSILARPSGFHGFGYDPFFHSAELGMSLADATVQQKRQVSHRGRAFDALLAELRTRGVIR